MYVVSEDNYLEHYGRKGMKWGQHIFGKDDGYKGHVRYGTEYEKSDLRKWNRDFRRGTRKQKVDNLISKFSKRYLKAETYFNQKNDIYKLSKNEQDSIFKQEEKSREEAGISSKYPLTYRALKPQQAKVYEKIKRDTDADDRKLAKINRQMKRYQWMIDVKYYYEPNDIDANNFVSARPVVRDNETGTEYPYSHQMVKSIINTSEYIIKHGDEKVK